MKTKRILFDGYQKMFFAFVDETTNVVETTSAKNWLKSSLKDNANDHTKSEIIKAILSKEKQFNKKVCYNIWVKSQIAVTFEQKLNYLFNNGFTNVTAKGIKVIEL